MRLLIVLSLILSYAVIGMTQDSWYRELRYEEDVPVTAFHMLTTENEIFVSGKANCTDSLGQIYSCMSLARHNYKGDVTWWKYLPWANSANEGAISLINDTLIVTGHSITRANNRLLIDFFTIEGIHIKSDEINYDSIYHEGGFFNNGQIMLERCLYVQCETGNLDDVTTTVTTKYNIDTGEYSHWDIHKDPIGVPTFAGYDFCLDIDSNFVVSSNMENIGGDSSMDTKQITKFDNEGNILDTFFAPNYDIGSSDVPPEMIVMPDGRYVITHNINEFIQNFIPQIVCIEPTTKEFCWKYDYASSLDTSRIVSIGQLSLTQNGDILGTGNDNIELHGSGNYYVFRLSPDGEMLWQRTFVRQDENDNYIRGGFRDVQELSDGSILAIGSNGDGQIGMMRLSADGCLMDKYCEPLNFLGGSTSVIETMDKKEFIVYPNPATEKITINLEPLTAENITVISIEGTIMIKRDFTSLDLNQLEIDVSSFPSGVYGIIINEEGDNKSETKSSKFIKF